MEDGCVEMVGKHFIWNADVVESEMDELSELIEKEKEKEDNCSCSGVVVCGEKAIDSAERAAANRGKKKE
jgi:hypothetical protein